MKAVAIFVLGANIPVLYFFFFPVFSYFCHCTVLARQMYVGRKWFVERYPDLTDSAVVAFHQVCV